MNPSGFGITQGFWHSEMRQSQCAFHSADNGQLAHLHLGGGGAHPCWPSTCLCEMPEVQPDIAGTL